jgi:hypothetical protein
VAAGPARIAKALPNALFVGCAQGFNKRLMGTFVTAEAPYKLIAIISTAYP